MSNALAWSLGTGVAGGSVGGGEMALGMLPRPRNGMRTCGSSLSLVDNRRLFTFGCCPETVEARARLDRSAFELLPDCGRRGGALSISGLLDVDDLRLENVRRLNDDLEPATMVSVVF